MTAVTQKYAALITAPWLDQPQTQFATFTFDDATAAQFPTWASVREELARRSAFKDADATTTGDTWSGASGQMPKALEVEKVDMLYLFELNPGLATSGVAPHNIATKPDLGTYVWPEVGTSGLAANLGGLTTFTIAGDNYLAGNIADADDTPPVIASITNAAALAGGAKAVQIGDSLVILVNGAETYNGVFVAGSGVIEVPAGDLGAAVSAADVYTLQAFIRKANGAQSRILERTLTNS